MDTHDSPLCASLGHFVGSIVVVWCPHRGAHILIVNAGDDADDTSYRSSRLDFGPFDSLEDVVARAQGEVARLLRADRAAWAAAREARG